MESAELLRRLRSEVQSQLHVVPDGWKTAEQWATEWGLRHAQVNKLLRIGVSTGIMEMQKFRVPCPIRASYPTPHYRQKPQNA